MIRFGMKLPEIFNQLVKGYQKVRGVEPKGLDLIKIKQEAMEKFQEMRKILDMQRNPIDPNKPIIGGKQLDKNSPGYFNDFTSMMIKDANVAPKVVRSGIMKTNEAMNPKFIDYTINSFKDMDGIKVMKEANKIIKREGPYKDLTKNDAKRIMDAVDDKLKNIDMDPEDMYADGGRIGLKDGKGIMQMASNDMNERLLEKIFDDLLDQGMDPKEAEIKAREIFNEMGNTSSIPDRGAPSITLADGGRAAFKDGLLAKLNKNFTLDGGTLRSMFFNKNNPIITGFNTAELFDLAIKSIGPAIGLADGGRAAFKDGPKDPRRRGFMKAAVGIASMLPFGIGKGVKMAAPAIEKSAEIAAPALAKIVETVMSLGKTISQSGRRVKEMVTKKKHKGVEVEEDIMDGSYTIKKDGKEIYFKPGKRDEMGVEDDIIEVIEKTVTKKASGGVARMLGE